MDDFYLFHLGFPHISARYNAIGNFSRITEVATRIANQLPNEGNSAAFKEFAWRFVNIIARALVALKRRPDYQQIRRYINDIGPLFVEYARYCAKHSDLDGWEEQVDELAGTIKERNLPMSLRGRSIDAIALMRFLQDKAVYDPVLDGLVSAFKYDKTYFDKIVSSVGPLMEKLTTGNIAALISPDYQDEEDHRPIFEWMDVIRRKGIVYVGLDTLTDTTVASAVGNSMFADLVSVAGHIYKHGVTPESSMPRKHYQPEEIIKLLRLVEIEVGRGKTTGQACKQLGFTEQSYYRWRKEYGGLQINQAKRLKELGKENTRLKKLVADLSLDKDILNEALRGNY